MSLYRYRVMCLFVGLVLTGRVTLFAAAVVAYHDWDTYPASPVWTDTYDAVSLQTMTTNGNTGGFLQVTFTDVDDFGVDGEFEIVQVPAVNFFSGTYDTSWFFSFDFWSSNTTPDGLKLAFQSSTNGSYWSYALSPITSTGWVSYGIALSTNGWSSSDPGQEPEQFLADLQSVSWIGIYIDRATRDQEFYGIDNFMLWAPEPEEWMLIALALIMCAMAERRRRLAEEPQAVLHSSDGPRLSFRLSG